MWLECPAVSQCFNFGKINELLLWLPGIKVELRVMYWLLWWRLGVQVARWKSDVLCSRAAQTVSVVKIQEIAISSYIPHPANVVAVALSPFRTDAGQNLCFIITQHWIFTTATGYIKKSVVSDTYKNYSRNLASSDWYCWFGLRRESQF